MHCTYFFPSFAALLMLSPISFTKSPNGWTDTDIALEWVKKVFNPETSVKAAGRTRVLLMDGHNSHFSLPFLIHCVANNIVVICYPAHCTHALQGLDVVCFAKMKHIWHAELDAHYETKGHHVNKNTYAYVFGTAFNKAFDQKTILAAFSATGVHPYNATVISERQMKPSEVTSTQTTFPLPMNSPVRRIMAVYHHQPATAFEQDPHTHEQHIPSGGIAIENPVTPKRSRAEDRSQQYLGTPYEQHSIHFNRTPETPTRTHPFISDASIDPSLFTPKHRARIFNATMAQSQSGSFLVSRARMNSAKKPLVPVNEQQPLLPEPDWTMIHTPKRSRYEPIIPALQHDNTALRAGLSKAHAQILAARSINEAANAQLVIQNIHGGKLNSALYEKEEQPKRKKQERFGADGKGLVYTSQDVMDIKRRNEEEIQERAEQKEDRAKFRAEKHEAVQKNKVQWDQIKHTHEELMKTYRKEVEGLQAQKVPKRLWHKAPSRPKKPCLPPKFKPKPRRAIDEAYMQEQEASGSEGNDDDNETDGPVSE